MISTTATGVKGNDVGAPSALSADGTKVAFTAASTNLDPADTDTFHDVYVKDLATGDLALVSTTATGTKGNHNSRNPSLSGDGTKVAFISSATNLDPADPDLAYDIYVKDLVTGDLTLVSTSDTGTKANCESTSSPTISADGTKVAFSSCSTNLDPADTDTGHDVYVKDLVTGDVTVASTTGGGIKGNYQNWEPSLSGDGSKVAFASRSSNLDPADADPVFPTWDVYVKDLATGDLALASTTGAAIKGNDDNRLPSLSGDGTKVGFVSESSNLDPSDTDMDRDVYVKDLVTGALTLASTSDTGVTGNLSNDSPTLSSDGTRVVFNSTSSNLDPADTDPRNDVYAKDLVTGDLTLVSITGAGVKGNGTTGLGAVSADGTKIALSSDSSNLDPADTDTVIDGYVKELGDPAPDADADGVPDESDSCITLAEDMDGIQDGDGCPESASHNVSVRTFDTWDRATLSSCRSRRCTAPITIRITNLGTHAEGIVPYTVAAAGGPSRTYSSACTGNAARVSRDRDLDRGETVVINGCTVTFRAPGFSSHRLTVDHGTGASRFFDGNLKNNTAIVSTRVR